MTAALDDLAGPLGLDLDEVDRAAWARATERGGEALEALLTHETWFFRDDACFAALTGALAGRGAVRVLSAGCSTGEEAWSIAIALEEAGVVGAVRGVDVSPLAIERARSGRYGAASFRAEARDPRGRWLAPDGDAWVVDEALRARVAFGVANLVARDGAGIDGPYDAILCRNVWIYLTDEARETLAARLARALAPGGVLFVGPAEAPGAPSRGGPTAGTRSP